MGGSVPPSVVNLPENTAVVVVDDDCVVVVVACHTMVLFFNACSRQPYSYTMRCEIYKYTTGPRGGVFKGFGVISRYSEEKAPVCAEMSTVCNISSRKS